MNRRKFLTDAALIAAGAVMTPEGLWVPGEKLISIPKTKLAQSLSFAERARDSLLAMDFSEGEWVTFITKIEPQNTIKTYMSNPHGDWTLISDDADPTDHGQGQ